MNRSILALLLGLPSPALGQAVARADLIGVWVSTMSWNDPKGPMTQKSYLVLRDDSTWARASKSNDQLTESPEKGSWAISNDSLWFGNVAVTDTIYYFGSEYMSGQIVPKWPSQRLELSEGKLRITDYAQFTKWQEDHQGKTPYPSIWFQEFTKSTEPEP